MREAIGGSFMVKLMMLFLVIYILFLAMALNYAKAFKAKNAIIDFIEHNEGNKSYVINNIDKYLDRISYNVPSEGPTGSYASSHSESTTKCYSRGYCLEKVNDDGRTKLRVITFIKFNFLDVNDNFDFTGSISLTVIQIVGEIQQYSPFWDEFEFN